MQVFRKDAGREAGVNRSLVVSVMVAGDHHDRHLRPRDRAHREREALLGDARRIEQVADYQQHVGVALIGDVDHAAEGGAHLVAQLDAALAGPERVGLEMNVGSVDDLQWAMRQFS